jgi:hypothetical protein
MPENPLTKFEYRLAREQRRTARITAKNARILAKYDLKKAALDTDDAKMAHWFVPWVTSGITLIICSLILGGFVSGAIKHGQEQANVTACEKAVTAAHVEADCATGKIGTGSTK